MKKVIAIIVITLCCIHTVKAIDLDSYRVERILKASSKTGYQEVVLDQEVYRYAKDDLSDIRIVNERGQEIPYYIVEDTALQKEVILPFEISEEQVGTTLKVKNENRMRFDEIVFYPNKGINKECLKRKVKIYYDSGDNTYTVCGEGNVEGVKLAIPMNEENFEIYIMDEGGEPLQLGQEFVRIQQLQDKLVFEGEANEVYKMYYGNELMQKPSYNMEKQPEVLEKHDGQQAVLGSYTIKEIPEKQERGYKDWVKNIAIITFAIGILSIIVNKNKK